MQCSYSETTPSKFAQAKTSTLAAVDLSKKGSVDQPISNLIELVNNLDDYFTTSSCSGRTIIVVSVNFCGDRLYKDVANLSISIKLHDFILSV